MGNSKWAVVVIVLFLIGTSVVALAGEEPGTFTGCLTPGGDLTNIAAGDLPTKDCKGNGIPVSFSAGDITAVFAGDGLVGGATVGDAPLSVDFDLLDGSYVNEGDPVPWSLLSGVPFGLGDGDDDTTYTAGPGLALNGTKFSVDFAGSGSASTAARSDHNHDGAYAPLSHDHDPPASDRIVQLATVTAAPDAGPGVVQVWLHFDTYPVVIGPGFLGGAIEVCQEEYSGVGAGGTLILHCSTAQRAFGGTEPPALTPNVLFFQVAGEGLYHFVFDLWDLRAGNMRALEYAEANGISYVGQDENGKVTIPVVVPLP